MALVYDPNLVTAATYAAAGITPPIAIDREWCLGDSLFFINSNFDSLDTSITSKFDKSGGTITGSLTGTGSATFNTLYTTGSIIGATGIYSTGEIYSANGRIHTGGNIECGGVFNCFSGPSLFHNDAVRIGRESGYNSSGAIAFRSNWNNTVYYFAAYRWQDSYFNVPRNGLTTDADLRVPGVLNANDITAGDIWTGTITAGAKSFLIKHPIKPNYKLKHYCVEGPNTDLLYRGKIKLTNGQAIVNIDNACGMTSGTVNAIGHDLTVTSLQNQTGFSRLKPTPIVDGQFTIICEDNASNDEVAWVVMGERKDLLNQEIELVL